jgi:AraC-like DNA-binding protein
MIEEQKSDYPFKDDLIRNYINLILHEAMKLQPSEHFDQQKNAASRIGAVFLELLERQFPVESPEKPLSLKTPQDYAQNMSIHVNYLNRMVKEATGKPTSNHIAERIITEAQALLQHTDWQISPIPWALNIPATSITTLKE